MIDVATYLVFLVIGLGAGAVYAALALGLVVVYKATGVINFAQGAMAMWGAYVFDEIRRSGDLVLPLGSVGVGRSFTTAIVLSLTSAAILGLATHHLVFRRLRTAPSLAKVVASVGLMLVLQATVVLRFGSEARAVAPVLPNEVVTVGTVSFARDRLYLAAIVVAVASVLWAYFRYTRPGLATRAASENERAAMLTGYSPNTLAAAAWALSTVTSTLVVLLASPSTGLNPVNVMLAVVPALAVALVGGLRSLATTCVAGLSLGAFQSEVTLLSARSWWPEWATTGVNEAIPLIVVIASLFLVGRSIPARGASELESLPPVWRPKNRPTVVAALAVLGVVALVLTDGSNRFAVITSMIYAVIALSLVLLTGLVGQVSLAQAAFAGVAGFTLSRYVGDALPFPVSMLAAGLAAGALGVLVGVPAVRIRGAQLAVVTLAGAVAVERLVFRNSYLLPPRANIIDDPLLLGIDLGVRRGNDLTRLAFGLLVLTTLVAVAVAVGNLIRSPTGRALLAVRSNERAAAAAGIDVAMAKLAAFGSASFIAGIGGALIGYSRGQVSADSFGVFTGLSLVAFAYLGGITSISGALVAGALAPLGIVYVLLDRNVDFGRYYLLVSGLSLVLTTIFNPDGISGKVRADITRLRPRWRPAIRGTGTGAITGATSAS